MVGRSHCLSATVTNQHSWFQLALLCGDWCFWIWAPDLFLQLSPGISTWIFGLHLNLNLFQTKRSSLLFLLMTLFTSCGSSILRVYQAQILGLFSYSSFISVFKVTSPCFFFFFFPWNILILFYHITVPSGLGCPKALHACLLQQLPNWFPDSSLALFWVILHITVASYSYHTLFIMWFCMMILHDAFWWLPNFKPSPSFKAWFEPYSSRKHSVFISILLHSNNFWLNSWLCYLLPMYPGKFA